MKYILAILIALSAFFANSCNEKQQLACTMEFRIVTITCNRDSLEHYYTIRELTGDTIRISGGNLIGDKVYPVLDDNFQPTLSGRTEVFHFQGTINDSIVVNEPFVIKADQCHIEYVSGNQVVN